MNHPALLPLLFACLFAGGTALAQSSCSSDGQAAPRALVERFISADCDTCWSDSHTPAAKGGELAIDWVLPGSKGDDAPLSAVATRDAADRLEVLGRPAPAKELGVTTAVAPKSRLRLRVAHGLPVNDYIGTSIEARPAGTLRSNVTAWLLLVETIAPGTEGAVIERNLVRNALKSPWNGADALSNKEHVRFFESRPMHVAEGARAARLRVVGWLQDDRGHVLAAAQSRCKPG